LGLTLFDCTGGSTSVGGLVLFVTS